VPSKVAVEMMKSYSQILKEEVLEPFPIMVDVQLDRNPALLQPKCWLGKNKTGRFTLRQLCKQLALLMPKGQQEWQVANHYKALDPTGGPRWRVCLEAGAALSSR
jgi:hypothetical protein